MGTIPTENQPESRETLVGVALCVGAFLITDTLLTLLASAFVRRAHGSQALDLLLDVAWVLSSMVALGVAFIRSIAVFPWGKMFNGQSYSGGVDSILSGWSISAGYNALRSFSGSK